MPLAEDEIRFVRCFMPHPPSPHWALVSIISSSLEKEFFLLGQSPRTFQRSNQDMGTKEIPVSLGLTHVTGREKVPSVPVCARWGASKKNQSGAAPCLVPGGRPHPWVAQLKGLKCQGTSKEGQLLPG